MKKVFLLFAAAAFSLSSMAQLEQDGFKLAATIETPAEGSMELPIIITLDQPTDAAMGFTTEIRLPGLDGKTAKEVLESGAVQGSVKAGKAKFDKATGATFNTDRGMVADKANVEIGKKANLIVNYNNPDDFITGTSGEVMRILYNCEYLADGDYEITISGPVAAQEKQLIKYYDETADEIKYIEGVNEYKLKFTKKDGNIAGVNRVVVDAENEKQEIYNIQGMKIRQTVPGRLYIVNGKKVIAQ